MFVWYGTDSHQYNHITDILNQFKIISVMWCLPNIVGRCDHSFNGRNAQSIIIRMTLLHVLNRLLTEVDGIVPQLER